jgi:hypothetical protein
VLRNLGSTGVILPIGDPHHGRPNAATLTTKGEEQVTFNWSEAPYAFDTPLDLTDPDSFQGIVPLIHKNGTDEEADTPDADYWSRVTAAFTIGMWLNLSDVTNISLLNKVILTTSSEDAEWLLAIGGASTTFFALYDTSAAATNWRMTRTGASVLVTGQWAFVVVTVNATQTAVADINLYLNGVVDNSGGTKEASFVAMETGAAKVALGYRIGASANEEFIAGKIAGGPLGPFFTQTELTADQVRALYDLGRAALAL